MDGYLLEWRVIGGAKAKNFFIKLFLVTLLIMFFLLVYFPRGINSYLAQNWKVTLFLKNGVDPEKGSIFAKRLGRIDFVRSSTYFSEEEVWNEFLSTVGNPENLKKVIGSPIPGFIEVTLKKEELNEKNLKKLIVIAEEEDLAKDILYGGTSFHRMIRIKTYLNASLIAAFVFFFLIIGVFLYYLDAELLLSAYNELAFMKEHGSGSILRKSSRLAVSTWEGFVSGLFSFGIAVSACHVLFLRFPRLKTYLAFPPIQDYRMYVFPFTAHVILITALYAFTSYQSLQKILRIFAGGK